MDVENGHKNAELYCRLTQKVPIVIEGFDGDDFAVRGRQHRVLAAIMGAFRITEKIERQQTQNPYKNSHDLKADIE